MEGDGGAPAGGSKTYGSDYIRRAPDTVPKTVMERSLASERCFFEETFRIGKNWNLEVTEPVESADHWALPMRGVMAVEEEMFSITRNRVCGARLVVLFDQHRKDLLCSILIEKKPIGIFSVLLSLLVSLLFVAFFATATHTLVSTGVPIQYQ
jgi:hypothetical protein